MEYYKCIEDLYRRVVDENILESITLDKKVPLTTSIMPNNERRIRLENGKIMYIVTDTMCKKEGDFPHQNAHEHLFSHEVSSVYEGEVISSSILPNGLVKLESHTKGDMIISNPGMVHNLTLFKDTIMATLKYPYASYDWYGTENTINSSASYYLDSRVKPLDLDEMHYIILKYNGIIDGKVVREFNLSKRWKRLSMDNAINPYEILINSHNREDIKKLISLTQNNDIAAFYLMLTNGNFYDAMMLYKIYQDDIELALSNTFLSQNNKPMNYAKEKKLIKR